MGPIRDEAIVLTRLDYSETSQVLVLFTRAHGKVRAIAKGIRRGTKQRFATGIDLLEVGHVNLSARGERSETLATLTEWKQTQAFSGLREKLDRIYGAEYAAEVTTALTEDWDPHPVLFDSLRHALDALCGAGSALPVVVDYQLRLLREIGSMPRLDGCVVCGRTGELTHFSSFEGGMICRHCEAMQVEKWEVGVAALDYLGARERGIEGTRDRGIKGTRDRGVEGARDQGVEGSRDRGATGPRDEGTKGRRDGGTEGCRDEGILDASRKGQAPGRRDEGDEPRARSERTNAGPIPPRQEAGTNTMATPAVVGAFGVLNYHISHLMGREPKLASKVVPPVRRRMV